MKTQLITAMAALAMAGAAWGQSNQISVSWGELGSRVNGKKVALTLPDGTSLQGKVRGVEAGGLNLDINKTSNKKVQPKGISLIPKSSVSTFRVIEYRKSGRLIGTLGALGAGAALTALAVSDGGLTEGPAVIALPAAGAAGTAGLGIAGYYFGKAIDKHETYIRVVPGN